MNILHLNLSAASIILAGFVVASHCDAQTVLDSQQKENTTQPLTVEFEGKKLPLIFEDTFDKGIGNWSTTDPTAWVSSKDANRDYFSLTKRKSDYQPEFRSPHNIALLNKHTVSDFVLTFDVRNMKDTGPHRDCCVFFCHQSPSKFYYAHLGAKPDPNSGQIMIVNQGARKAITKNENEVAWDDQWHRIKLTYKATSGEIKIYFDDMKTPVMQAADPTFKHGSIGLGSFDDMNDFDNIRLFAERKG